MDQAIRALVESRQAASGEPDASLEVALGRAAEMLGERGWEIATLISQEQGKPLSEATDEVATTVGLLESFSRASYRLGQQFQPLAVEARIGNRFGFTRQRPVGINALLTPNTFPLLIPAKLLLPSLAAGDSVILKPAYATPLSTLRLLRIFTDAGVPMHSVTCITGPGEVTGQAICRHPLVDQVSYQGASATLKAVRTAMGPVPLRYCHGGSTLCVVAADADLDRAVAEIVRQRFENAGQTAISASSVYVEAAIASELVERLSVAIQRLSVGDPLAPGTRIGPLTERTRVNDCVSMLGALTMAGARLVCGGACLGSVVSPILLADVPPRHEALCKGGGFREVLGPILTVSTLPGPIEDMVPWIDRRTQLVVSIFSRDLDRATRVASSLPVFNIHVNGIPTWRDGVVFTSDGAARLGRRQVEVRVKDVSVLQDIVFHPL